MKENLNAKEMGGLVCSYIKKEILAEYLILKDIKHLPYFFKINLLQF